MDANRRTESDPPDPTSGLESVLLYLARTDPQAAEVLRASIAEPAPEPHAYIGDCEESPIGWYLLHPFDRDEIAKHICWRCLPYWAGTPGFRDGRYRSLVAADRAFLDREDPACHKCGVVFSERGSA